MQTHFSLARLADPHIAMAEGILRSCVHCGFCTATCPTFTLLGDELDSPRGRIYLIKDMLENDRPADAVVTQHIDRCLSCLSCMTTCPSGVHYMHLVDHARAHVEKTFKRPFHDRALRFVLAKVMPYPARFRLMLRLAGIFGGLAGLLPLPDPVATRLQAALKLVPKQLPKATPAATIRHIPERGRRVAILTGCAQSVLAPGYNEAATRLLARLGVEVVRPGGEGCCGSLAHHMGREEEGLSAARVNIDAWMAEIDGQGLEAILITASGCGTTIKDYGHMFRLDPAYAEKAARVAALTRDVTEYLATLDLPPPQDEVKGRAVTYHAPCSMQHGQKIRDLPVRLLREAGFVVKEPDEGHLCCGSAGTYNILQSELSDQLLERKLANIAATAPEIIATGNIGCATQLGTKAPQPVVHTVELLDWAYGGKKPSGLSEG